MKWIRRKPSLRVYGWTMVSCFMVLIYFGVWITGPVKDRLSFIGTAARYWVVGSQEYRGVYHDPSCYVIERDGRVQVLGDGSIPSGDQWREHDTNLFIYKLIPFKYGFFAPTKLRIGLWMDDAALGTIAYPKDFFAFSNRWGLGLTPNDDGFFSIDRSLAQGDVLYEYRTLWSGYVINTIVLAAFIGFLWTLWWTPYRIRYQIQRERYLRGLCPLCKYNVSATPGRCPECGWGHASEANGDWGKGIGDQASGMGKGEGGIEDV